METEQNNEKAVDNSADHLQKLLLVQNKRMRGDIRTAADILGLELPNAQRALERIGSKHHNEVVSVLYGIISNRESLRQAHS